ncbi:MAG: endonuclease I family protein [Oceanipulchritudo sp.]
MQGGKFKVLFRIGWLGVGILGSIEVRAQDYLPPSDYYEPAEGLLGNALREALHDVIDDQFVASYNTVGEAMLELDRDPEVDGNILLLYSGDSVPHGSDSWNREHTWPRSFGADSGPAYSDAHHLFPADADSNTARWNYPYDELVVSVPLADSPESRVNDGLQRVEPRDGDKGRIARALFYMETRYGPENVTGDFTLSDEPLSAGNRMGVLSTLLKWNRAFPPDEREKRRNHLIYTGFRAGNVAFFQTNRNPYVDFPELVDAVFTGDDYMSWGAWIVDAFTFAEMQDPLMIGPTADPDLDGFSNFLEFAIQSDPLQATTDDLPYVNRGDGLNSFSYRRIKQPEESYTSYSVEVAEFPLDAGSWQEIPFTDRDLLILDKGLFQSVSLPHTISGNSRPLFYRLGLTREVPGQDPLQEIFDPALHEAGLLHLFTYTLPGPDGWQQSDWFGEVRIDTAPWFQHFEHGWLHTDSLDEMGAWFFDMAIGWVYTGIDLYPYLYSSAREDWLFFVGGTLSPARWFFSLTQSAFISEQNLNKP